MAFQNPSNASVYSTSRCSIGKNLGRHKRICKDNKYISLVLMKNNNSPSMEAYRMQTFNRARFLQIFSLNLLTVLELDKIAALTTKEVVEKKSITETISEGVSKIFTRKGDQDASYKKDSDSKSSAGIKHGEPLSEDQEETAEALIEKLRARQQAGSKE